MHILLTRNVPNGQELRQFPLDKIELLFVQVVQLVGEFEQVMQLGLHL
jgi:hypothetical protein